MQIVAVRTLHARRMAASSRSEAAAHYYVAQKPPQHLLRSEQEIDAAHKQRTFGYHRRASSLTELTSTIL